MTPGVFKAFLYHAEFKKIKSNLTVAQTNGYSFLQNENLSFLPLQCHGNKQYFIYRNFFESVYLRQVAHEQELPAPTIPFIFTV